jgi:hypothetical protein
VVDSNLNDETIAAAALAMNCDRLGNADPGQKYRDGLSICTAVVRPTIEGKDMSLPFVRPSRLALTLSRAAGRILHSRPAKAQLTGEAK